MFAIFNLIDLFVIYLFLKNCRELRKSVNKTRSLIESYNVILKANGNEQDQSNNKLLSEIRTNLRSINWDIQDLEETISKTETAEKKF